MNYDKPLGSRPRLRRAEASQYLEEKHGGWEINEGSFGEFVFDVEARSLTLDYYGRIIDHEHSSHSF